MPSGSGGEAGGAQRLGWVSTGRDLLSLVRDGLLLLLLLLLVLLPDTLNGVLTRAGITKASAFGVEWEARLDTAIAQTTDARSKVQELERQLATYSDGVERIARLPPAAQAESARHLAADIRKTRVVAERVGSDLGKTVDAQRELKRRAGP